MTGPSADPESAASAAGNNRLWTTFRKMQFQDTINKVSHKTDHALAPSGTISDWRLTLALDGAMEHRTKATDSQILAHHSHGVHLLVILFDLSIFMSTLPYIIIFWFNPAKDIGPIVFRCFECHNKDESITTLLDSGQSRNKSFCKLPVV